MPSLQPRKVSNKLSVILTIFLSALSFFFIIWPAVSFSQEPVREIAIKAAVSPAFKTNPEWETDIRDRVLFANRLFEPVFGIHFTVRQTIEWTPEDETRPMDLLIEELRSFIALSPEEVVVGFHRMSRPLSKEVLSDMDTVGQAQFFRGFVMIRDPFTGLDSLHREVVFTHELGHLFGAVHVSDETAIMNAKLPFQPAQVFDTDNQDIIRSTRTLDFQKGLDSIPGESIDGLIRVYEKLIRLHPQSDFYLQLGHFYGKRGQSAKAISVWEEAVRYHYDNPYIHRELGVHYFESARYEQAIRSLGSAVAHFILPSQKKQRAHTFNLLGVAYYEKGNLEQAIFNWLQGLTADPDDPTLQANLAVTYLQKGDTDRGIAELLKLAAKNQKDPTTLSNLGAAYLNVRDYEKALDYLKRALENLALPLASMEPGSAGESRAPSALMGEVSEAEVRLNLGVALLEQGKAADAVSELKRANELHPDNALVYRPLARAYLTQQEHERAIKEIENGLRYTKDDPYLYAMLGQAYAETGRRAEAMQALREGLRYAKDELAANFHKNMAVLYAQDRDFTRAMAEFKTALNQNWKDPEAHTQLGMVYATLGKIEDAKRSFENALRIEPQHEAAKQALDSLAKNGSGK